MPTLATTDSCTGCSACYSSCPVNCIEMVKDKYGFFRPSVDLTKCINCRKCERSCPVINKQEKMIDIDKCYAMYTNDFDVRLQSSSGGIFSELAKVVINKNGIVYGAVYDKSYEVVHQGIENINDLKLLRGAKYAQSNLNDTLNKVLKDLKQDRYVLFCGTPCQVAGLKSFLKNEYDKLYCIDFVCHGVPSPLAWKSFINYILKTNNKLDLPNSINLRSKTTGWSKYSYCHEFKFNDENIICENKDSIFMKLFVGDYINGLCCSNCKFKGKNRYSDLTLGDFWGIWDIYPKMDDNKGTSLVCLNTEKGRLLINSIISDCTFKELELDVIKKYNKSYCTSSKANENRHHILELISEGNFRKIQKLIFSQKSKGVLNICEKLKVLKHQLIK